MADAGRAPRVLLVGLGGLGCPAASVLARARGVELWLCDDDQVDVSNLHRQILYRETDVGHDKLEAAQAALVAAGADPARIVLVRSRLLPENARQLVRVRSGQAGYHVLLGDAYKVAGQASQARAAYETAARMGSRVAKQRLKQL